MIKESSHRISSLSKPTALSRPSALRELLHTSSPRSGDWWAGENFRGFISKRRTRTPGGPPARPPHSRQPPADDGEIPVFGFRFSVFGGHVLWKETVMGRTLLHSDAIRYCYLSLRWLRSLI